MALNNETMKKIFGDPAIDLADATRFNAARLLLSLVREELLKQVKEDPEERKKLLEKNPLLNLVLNESVLAFGLAGALQMLPTDIVQQERDAVAGFLRLQAWAGLEQGLVTPVVGALNRAWAKSLRAANDAASKSNGAGKIAENQQPAPAVQPPDV